MLTLYRRHLPTCPHRTEGRIYQKCQCPIHCDGMLGGRRIRGSLDTANWERARKHLRRLEDALDSGLSYKLVSEAAEAFLANRSVEPSTARKYRRNLQFLAEFMTARDREAMDQIRLEDLDAYRASRPICALSWSKELQLLRTFFEFCRKRKWCRDNPAKEMEMPPEPKPRERKPYTPGEITKIIWACDAFGRHPYERLRARAMILILRFYALRISDVATLERSRIHDDYILVRALKNGQMLWLPLRPEVRSALDILPLPQGADPDCRYFFWTGKGNRDGFIKTAVRTLQSVFKKSGVERAGAHRFRHTLTTEILVAGGTIEDAANILGDSPRVIQKYYAKWSRAYQDRTVALFNRVHGTPLAHGQNTPPSDSLASNYLVLEEGVEPSCPVKGAGF